MKKSDEQERNIANRLYNLDKKVYETTGSTLGRVFPSSPSFALEKIIDALKINREYFLKNEMTLIANMIGTIRDEEKAAPLKQEYDELEKDILAYNPTIILPHSIVNNDAVASRSFSSDNHLSYASAGNLEPVGIRLALNWLSVLASLIMIKKSFILPVTEWA